MDALAISRGTPNRPNAASTLFWPPARRCTTLCVEDFLVPMRIGQDRQWCTAPRLWVLRGGTHDRRADVAVFVHSVFDALFGFGRSRQLGCSRLAKCTNALIRRCLVSSPMAPWHQWWLEPSPPTPPGCEQDGSWAWMPMDWPEFATTGQNRNALQELRGGDRDVLAK